MDGHEIDGCKQSLTDATNAPGGFVTARSDRDGPQSVLKKHIDHAPVGAQNHLLQVGDVVAEVLLLERSRTESIPKTKQRWTGHTRPPASPRMRHISQGACAFSPST